MKKLREYWRRYFQAPPPIMCGNCLELVRFEDDPHWDPVRSSYTCPPVDNRTTQKLPPPLTWEFCDNDGNFCYRLEIEAMAGGADPTTKGDFPGWITLLITYADGTEKRQKYVLVPDEETEDI